ncbi:pseudoazurin [Devosia sp. D6-9]|nr:pseudoazurin [Devosia sp. D6-9]
MRLTRLTLAGLVVAALSSLPALAADFEVKMLNKGSDGSPMVFEPALTQIQPGDTVHFIAASKGHNAETIPGMFPEGAEAFKSPIGKDFSFTFKKDGIYGIRCTPHYGMGMVAMIVVGEPTNLDEAKGVKQPGKAADRFEAIFTQLGAAK